MQQILENRRLGIKITLDSDEIFPDDPGNGTPAIVQKGRFTATFWCADDTGELDCGSYQMTEDECAWVRSQSEAVDAFIEKNSPTITLPA